MKSNLLSARSFLLVLGALSLTASHAVGQDRTPDTPEQLLEAWVDLWGSYDLDTVSDLFLMDDRLTYFSSETEGLLSGFDRIVEHHRGFGFVPGGSERDRVIWVGDTNITRFGDTALITAIWYFGDPAVPDEAQHGPMTVLALRTSDGYRIAHMNFATYAASSPSSTESPIDGVP
jgi:ketosteroid isomerase-like protein